MKFAMITFMNKDCCGCTNVQKRFDVNVPPCVRIPTDSPCKRTRYWVYSACT